MTFFARIVFLNYFFVKTGRNTRENIWDQTKKIDHSKSVVNNIDNGIGYNNKEYKRFSGYNIGWITFVLYVTLIL